MDDGTRTMPASGGGVRSMAGIRNAARRNPIREGRRSGPRCATWPLALALLAGVTVRGEPGNDAQRTPREETGPARPLSESRLGIHLIGRYTPGAQRIVRAGPRVLKVLDPQSNGDMLRALDDYKRRFPEGVTVVRVWENTPGLRFSPRDDPQASADVFWRRVLLPAIRRIPPEKRRLIDYLEGPNECEHFPAWQTPAAAHWYAVFWTALAKKMAAAGFRPCVGAIPVGNPPGNRDEVRAKIAAFVPALRETKRLHGAWSYHAYTIEYTTSLDTERWYSLRYRQFYDVFRSRFPDLLDLPLIITEAGVDRGGNPETDGWRARGDADRYMKWLRWFDGELRKDRYVIGATLFEIGDPRGWRSFDLEPIADRLAGYLERCRRPAR